MVDKVWSDEKTLLGGGREILGRKVRQTLPTLLFVDPAGGKVKKMSRSPPPASHMSLAIHFSNCNNKRLTLTNISLNIVNNIKTTTTEIVY